MRLAFSVATAKRPDILIVDEALSVGDAYFQHKSFGRIQEFRRAGTTLLLVSHDMQAVQTLCDRAVLLDDGKIAKEGDPQSVADFYNAMLANRQNQALAQRLRDDGLVATVSGTGEAAVEDIALFNMAGNRVEVVDVGEQVTLQVTVTVKESVPRLVLGYMIKDRLGQVMFGTNTHLREMPLEHVRRGERITYEFSFPANFGPGSYSVSTALVSTDTHLVNNYEWRDLALMFRVVNQTKTHFAGCAWIEPEIEIVRT
jgi:lipopolysaccharide transport system ATP-binding protein